MSSEDHHMIAGEHSKKEIIKFAVVILAIASTAFLANWSGGLENYLRWFMAIFFLVFAGFKFLGYEMFVVMFRGYDILAKKYRPYAYAYPFIEFILGVLYFLDLVPVARELLTIIIMAIGTKGVWQEVKKRSGVHCACLGNIIKLPLSTVSLVEDVGMGLMALVMLVIGFS